MWPLRLTPPLKEGPGSEALGSFLPDQRPGTPGPSRRGGVLPQCSRASRAHFHFQAVAVSDPTSLKNAKNAILEELPRIVNTMALLWDVLRKETQKRPVDLLGATKGSSSVYFRTTKVRSSSALLLLVSSLLSQQKQTHGIRAPVLRHVCSRRPTVERSWG